MCWFPEIRSSELCGNHLVNIELKIVWNYGVCTPLNDCKVKE